MLTLKEFEELLDDFESKAMNEATENGPDRDYRRFAREEKEAVRAEILKKVEELLK